MKLTIERIKNGDNYVYRVTYKDETRDKEAFFPEDNNSFGEMMKIISGSLINQLDL